MLYYQATSYPIPQTFLQDIYYGSNSQLLRGYPQPMGFNRLIYFLNDTTVYYLNQLIFIILSLMEQQLLQQLSTVQNYIETLFDSLPKIQLHSDYFSSNIDTVAILQQNIQYGRKIIELSEKFTAKYRKDHFFDRKQVEQKINLIFRYMCPNNPTMGLDEMVSLILRRVQEMSTNSNQAILSRSVYGNQPLNVNSRANSGNNQIINYGTKQSKLEVYRDQLQLSSGQKGDASEGRRKSNLQNSKQSEKGLVKSNMEIQNVVSPQLSRLKKSQSQSKKVSKVHRQNKQKQSEIGLTSKSILQIKSFFEQEEKIIQKALDKLAKQISEIEYNQKGRVKISAQNKEYTKQVNQLDTKNLKEYVQASIENNKFNINKISELIDMLHYAFEKKSLCESLAQGKFQVYVDQINRRQQIYSFAVSKLIQNLNTLRQSISEGSENQESQPFQILENLEQISQQFYNIYPSHSILKDLKIEKAGSDIKVIMNQKDLQRLGYKHEGVQVNLIGSQKSEKIAQKELIDSKRNLLQMYKTSTRVNEMLERFERAIKFKKNIEQKQIEKFIDSIRQSLPRKTLNNTTANSNQLQSYQQQLKRIMQVNEKNQKQLSQQCNRKIKRYQKSIAELEKTLQQIIQQNRKEKEKQEQVHKKTVKKLQQQKEENKKLISLKELMQKNVREMRAEIDRLEKNVRDNNFRISESENIYKEKVQALEKQNKGLNSKIVDLQEKNREQTEKIEEEREIYHQKIIFLQTQDETRNQQYLHLKYELEEMIKENTVLKKQIEELTQVYEDKIRELEDLIQNIKQLEDELKMHHLENKQLKEQLQIQTQKNVQLQKEKNKHQKQISKIEQKLKQKVSQADKYKQLGILNESDIAILKQEMQKVKEAYMESEDQVQHLRGYIDQLESQKDFLVRQNRNFRRQVDGYNEKWQSNQNNIDKIQRSMREAQDQASLKKRQLSYYASEVDQSKKQIGRLKKQLLQSRENNTKMESQLRNIRQQLQKKTETDSLDLGKKKLQIEAAKIELKRKTQQLQKMKESYQQKIEVLQSKNKQLSQFITQKQMLAKITTNHLSQ